MYLCVIQYIMTKYRSSYNKLTLAMVKLLESENVDLIENLNMNIVMPYITNGILISTDVFDEIDNAVYNYLSKYKLQ